MSELEDRRQRAREAFWDRLAPPRAGDTMPSPGEVQTALENGIETATRVKVTDEVINEFAYAWHGAPQDGPPGTRRRAGLTAALRALGFEVEE